MFNLISECIWAIHHSALLNLQQLMRTMPSSGPAEDAQRNDLPIVVRGSVAVIPVRGAMVKYDSWINKYWGLTSMLLIRQALQAAVVDPDVEQILLLLDTPGGSVTGLTDLGDAVKAASAIKPVIAQVDSMTASAGYYIASQATKIYAGRMDMIGSIGTRMALLDMSKMYKEAGVEVLVFDTGEYKSAGEPGTQITDAQKVDFQRIVNGYFADFREMVQAGRGLNDAQFQAVADGRMFFADEALNLGLIDGIQSIEETLSKLVSTKPVGRSTASARRRIAALSG